MQIAWFNMFATSGLSGLDVIIGDDHVVLADEEPYFTERVVRVPGSYLTFEVNYPVPDVAPAPSLRRPAISFGCLAPQYKITVDVVEAWSRILKQCPGTSLLLKNVILGEPSARAYLLDLFGQFSVPPGQIILEGPAEHFAFLERYADIDIALDTFPYNGGTTTMEAIWQGVPVLTFWGDRWASRISASILREAGLGDYVTDGVEQYVERAIALAEDPSTPERLQTLREQSRDRLRSSTACDVAAFAGHMESLFCELIAARSGSHPQAS
jgi:predicted O-linked N-acetylglucosamine transferase (SPINDLY family)